MSRSPRVDPRLCCMSNPKALSSWHNSDGKLSEAIPLATFAYIGVELLTTTAFEARYPKELRLPAANIGWFSTVLYTIATGSFVANLSWQDRNLPQLFQQALSTIIDRAEADKLANFEAPMVTRAAPLIALYRAGFRFLPDS